MERSEFLNFWGFQNIFRCEDFVDILGVDTTLDYSKHFKVNVNNGNIFGQGVAGISNSCGLHVCLIFLILTVNENPSLRSKQNEGV